MSWASPEYTIDVLEDAAPRISFNKPGRDTHAMSLDEVFLQVKADDDYGVKGIQLFYSINGGPEKSIGLYAPQGKPLSEVTAGHTLYLEELGVKPGDSVSYYAKAQDNDVVSAPGGKPATSDIYFIEVDPFSRNFRQAQSQEQMQGQGQGQQGQRRQGLAAQQKEIIAATFNADRDQKSMGADKYKEATVVIRLQQEKLRGQVEELISQMMERLQGNEEFKKIADLLMQSIGLNPAQFSKRGKLIALTRLIPFVERNYNLVELGPKGTGKSHTFSEFSPNGILISGGEVTLAKLFVTLLQRFGVETDTFAGVTGTLERV